MGGGTKIEEGDEGRKKILGSTSKGKGKALRREKEKSGGGAKTFRKKMMVGLGIREAYSKELDIGKKIKIARGGGVDGGKKYLVGPIGGQERDGADREETVLTKLKGKMGETRFTKLTALSMTKRATARDGTWERGWEGKAKRSEEGKTKNTPKSQEDRGVLGDPKTKNGKRGSSVLL